MKLCEDCLHRKNDICSLFEHDVKNKIIACGGYLEEGPHLINEEQKTGCKCAIRTDEYHGWECSITEGACMFLYPDSKACGAKYGEGPDAWDDEEDLEEGL